MVTITITITSRKIGLLTSYDSMSGTAYTDTIKKVIARFHFTAFSHQTTPHRNHFGAIERFLHTASLRRIGLP